MRNNLRRQGYYPGQRTTSQRSQERLNRNPNLSRNHGYGQHEYEDYLHEQIHSNYDPNDYDYGMRNRNRYSDEDMNYGRSERGYVNPNYGRDYGSNYDRDRDYNTRYTDEFENEYDNEYQNRYSNRDRDRDRYFDTNGRYSDPGSNRYSDNPRYTDRYMDEDRYQPSGEYEEDFEGRTSYPRSRQNREYMSTYNTERNRDRDRNLSAGRYMSRTGLSGYGGRSAERSGTNTNRRTSAW